MSETQDAAATPEADDAPAAPTFEERATVQGWLPKGEYKGPEDKWVDAETFVKRGEEILPFVQANNKAMEKALKDANGTIARLEKNFALFQEHHTKTEQRAYERAKSELEGKLERAAEIGDVAGVKAVSREISDLDKDAAAPKPTTEAAKPDVKAMMDAWIADGNDWFTTDPVMQAWAVGVGAELAGKGVTDPAEQFAEVSRRVKTAFPAKFTNPRRSEAPAVGGQGAPRTSSGKTYSDLPPDAKSMCDSLVKDIKGFTREKYLKDYYG